MQATCADERMQATSAGQNMQATWRWDSMQATSAVQKKLAETKQKHELTILRRNSCRESLVHRLHREAPLCAGMLEKANVEQAKNWRTLDLVSDVLCNLLEIHPWPEWQIEAKQVDLGGQFF